MPDHPVSLVVWKDAKKEPPGYPGDLPTDVGIAWHSDISGRWFDRNGAFGSPALEHQPSLWCDPVPPSEDALTLDDLRAVVQHAEDSLDQVRHLRDEGYVATFRRQVARLRRAIEAAEKGS